MVSSESNKVGKIIEVLKSKYYFQKDLLISHPNLEDIKNKAIQKVLSTASKTEKGKGKNLGRPDIYYCNEEAFFLLLVEVKPKTSQHEEAKEDINHYLSCFKEFSQVYKKYKIVGLAISGDIEEEDDKIIEQITNKINDKLDAATISTPDRVSLVAGIFIVLHHKEGTEEKEILKNIYDANLERLDRTIKTNFFTDVKAILEEEFSSNQSQEIKKVNEKIEAINRVVKPIVESNNFKNKRNTTLAEVTKGIYEIIQITSRSKFAGDVLARLFQGFLRYWTNDGKKFGILLTPWHATELMVDLIDKFKEGGITTNDICLDPCCGSGTFLLTFMKKQLSLEGVDEEKIKENLIGIEKNEQMYLLSIANMLTREDGKANLQLKNFLMKT